MQSALQSIETAYQRKVSLFQELLNCVASERNHLINLNVENLWEIMDKKKKILESIQDLREQIKKIAKEDSTYQNALGKERWPIIEHSRKIASLKKQIKTRVKENVTFIQESLQSFDEIISIFTMDGRLEFSYSPVRKHRKETTIRIYQRKV
jgi:flagellar biosynthesis/type III secretory pathway chaperone